MGPLYVILPNKSEKFGEVSGLPTDRYQFHFQDNQFMNKHDKRVNLVELMNGPMKELKPLFKKEFQKNLSKFRGDSRELQIEYPRDAVSEYVAIYGWDDLFKNLDRDITSIDFTNNSKEDLNLKFPKELGQLQNLQTFFVENAISEVPEELKNIKSLEFISFPNNKKLSKLPEWLADLPNLTALSAKGTDPNLEIPERLKQRLTPWGGPVWFVHND
jgi:Leucine-rich repeat (LRR) protein